MTGNALINYAEKIGKKRKIHHNNANLVKKTQKKQSARNWKYKEPHEWTKFE